ncbi:MAG: class I SAM-dependent RNA methyltransferase [Gemmatimonadaceae bacterium]
MNATLRIESLAAGGDGVGRSEGLAVFVPRTAPGDVVDVELEPHGRFARGRVLAWRELSSDRVDPPCVHYTRDRCGGCQLQHLREDAQRSAKTAIVRDALVRIGKVAAAVHDIRPAPAPWRYRISLTLAIRRHGRGTTRSWTFGLRDYEDPERIFAMEDCLITDQRVLGAWSEVRAAAHLLPNAERLRGTVRWIGAGAAFSLTGGTAWPDARSAALSRHCPSLLVAYWNPEGATRRKLWDQRPQPAPPALSFTQVNPPVAKLLHDEVIRHALAHAPRTAIDAYSGAGDTAAALAEAGVAVSAIEVDREAAEFAARRLTPPSRSVAQRVEQALERALPADVVILNPPRAGVAASVTRALDAAMPPPHAIVYVSCDPATLGRDVGRLRSFAVASAEPYDMFPQTAHVETLCELVKR